MIFKQTKLEGTYKPGSANTRDKWVSHDISVGGFTSGAKVCLALGSFEIHYLEGDSSDHNISQFGFFTEIDVIGGQKATNIFEANEEGYIKGRVWVTLREFARDQKFMYHISFIAIQG